MKDCSDIKALLFDFVSGKMDKESGEKVKKHIEECESCRKEYEAQKFYVENLPCVSEYLDISQKDIKTAVMQKIKEEKENPPIYVPKRFHFSYGTAASLVLVAALFIFAAKTGIADKNVADLASFECAVEESEQEAVSEGYDMTAADNASGTGSVLYADTYFSASEACDNEATYDGITSGGGSIAHEPSEERVMMMAAPPEAKTTVNGCAEEAVPEEELLEKKADTQCDELPVLTVEKLRSIVAEKGEDLTWSDFEAYEHIDVGSGIYIFRYPISEHLYLTVSGIPDSKPFEIRLVSEADDGDYITLPDGDIDGFVKRING